MTQHLELIILSIIGCSLFFQLFYYINFFLRIAVHKNSDAVPFTPPISVIIAARNEAKNLKQNLTSVLEQEYSNFEVWD